MSHNHHNRPIRSYRSHAPQEDEEPQSRDYDAEVDRYISEKLRERGVLMGGAFERHGQTVLQLLIAALLGWFGLQVVEQGRSLVRMEVTVETLATQFSVLQQTYLDRSESSYPRADAIAQHSLTDGRVDEMEKRLSRLETFLINREAPRSLRHDNRGE